MPLASKRKYTLLLLLSFVLGAGFSLLTRAQAQSPSRESDNGDDSGENARPFLNLNVTFAPDGSARLYFFAFTTTGDAGPQTDQGEIRSALESSLGCTLGGNAAAKSAAGVFSGSCDPSFSRSSTLREFHIATTPLIKYARDHQVEDLTLSVRLPDVEVAETQPQVVTKAQWHSGKASAHLQRFAELNRTYFWKTDGPIPDLVTVRFGVSPQSANRAAAILLAVLILPVLLIYWMGRKALASEAQDKAVVWFTYMRYMQWTLNLSLVGWWVAADSLHLVDLLRLLCSGTRLSPLWNFPVVPTFVAWLPPMLVWVVCFALSHPVQEKLRGLSWTRGELALQALYSCAVSLVPLAMFLTGLNTIAAGSARFAFVWFVSAFVVRLFALRARQKFLGMQPQALTTGELRDKAFGMAKQLDVKLQQVYVIPSGKGQMANAFARQGNIISFTDFLLQRMTRREVNYVLAHELSHLKLGHPGKLALASVVSYFVAMTALGFADPFLHITIVTRYAVIVGIVTLVPYFCSRRFEYAADAGAVAATGDPQAAISALFKLAQLNMLPIHWSNWTEKWLTHPSSMRRAQAVARKAGIPPENVSAIAQAAAASDEGYYVLPATVAPGAKVHSSHAKQGGTLLITYLMLATIIFTPAAFAILAAHSGPNTQLSIGIYLAGLASTLGMYYVWANFAPPLRLTKLVSSLKTKFAKEGVQAEAWDGVFVGFSPAAAPRIYEANTNWDLGCLFLRSDRVCYWGEETKFSLRRDQITALKLAPGVPGLLPPWRIYCAWKDEERGTSGVFNIGCIDGGSTLGLRNESAQLAERLNSWWKSSVDPKPLPGPLAALSSPQIGVVTGGVPGKGMNGGKGILELAVVGMFAIVGAVLCGLPFHLMQFLISGLNPAYGEFTPFHSPGAGWYVVFAAVATRLMSLIPVFRYKDVAIVNLGAPSSPPNRPSTTEARADTRVTQKDREGVLTR